MQTLETILGHCCQDVDPAEDWPWLQYLQLLGVLVKAFMLLEPVFDIITGPGHHRFDGQIGFRFGLPHAAVLDPFLWFLR